MATGVHDRPFVWDDDVLAINQFLLETYTRFGRVFNWEPRRWQGTVYHNNDADMARHRRNLPEQVRVWVDAGDNIVGVVIPERPGSVFLQIHPDHRDLEAKMLDWAEAQPLRNTDSEGRPCLDVWAEEHDTHRTALLLQRGYTRTDAHEILRHRSMQMPVPHMPVPEGYRVRAMRDDPGDRQAMANLLNTAFQRTFHSAEEYRNFQTAPDYRAEMDIVVEAPDGTLAATAGFTVHERESFAIVEPVCTHPDHQGRKLAGIAIAEGLRRAAALGIMTAYVGAWYSNPVSNHLYQKMGFSDGISLYLWRRYD